MAQHSPHPRQLGRYEVVGLLAQGGMAELFLARLPGIEGFTKRVVVKRVLPGLARDREFITLFLEEARLAATLHHQNIVAVHDIGEDDTGPFFAMEHLHGADVGEILRVTDGDLPLEIALEIARGACAGLHYAHERKGPGGAPLGVVHRDVSPQNLFVTFDGGVKLLDFGIAKAVHRIASHLTRSGTLRGKLPYMSPEQCRGEPIDRRSDVFSLAVVLWEMTAGERLFGARGESEFEILKSIVERDAPRPSSRKPGYPAALEAIVMRGLARDPARRFASCDQLQGELEALARTAGRWATARDVAAFMQRTFTERAATSLQLPAMKDPPQGEIVPFPGTRVVVQPPADVTVDLPKPARLAPGPPPAPPPGAAGPATPAPPPSAADPVATVPPGAAPAPGVSRPRVAFLVGAAMALTALVMALGFWLGHRPAAAPGAPAAGNAAPTPAATGAISTELAVGATVEGLLQPDEVRRYPVAFPGGQFRVELFIQAPSRASCNGQPSIDLRIVDRDDAMTDARFTQGTWETVTWEKGTHDFTVRHPETFTVVLHASHNCPIHYRVRIAPAEPHG